jgi:energy-coupling factor transporter ATP-binding protein EcfA2
MQSRRSRCGGSLATGRAPLQYKPRRNSGRRRPADGQAEDVTTLAATLAQRLDESGVDRSICHVVLAAIDGPAALDKVLVDGVLPEAITNADADEPLCAYVTGVTVEGFRGIGPPATLELAAGPGLTLVVGRNGSGKSSFAEALEVLLTRDNQRWARRSAVWREGWRNLHHPSALIEATLSVEGSAGATTVTREWPSQSDLEAGTAEVQPHGKPKTDLRYLGWEQALITHRPFLSYSELGAMLDEGPTKLHDAVALVLGLEELAMAEKALKDARLARERALKEVAKDSDEICRSLDSVNDDRARRVTAALQLRQPALGVIEEAVTNLAVPPMSDVALLRRAAAVEFPEDERVEAVAAELLAAHAQLAELAGTQTDRLLRSADLLERAIAFRDLTDNDTCPVCATPAVLSDTWAQEAAAHARKQRQLATEAETAQRRASTALQTARALVGPVPAGVHEIRQLLDVSAVAEAWSDWVTLAAEVEPTVLAQGLRHHGGQVRTALAALRRAAEAEIGLREDAWRPVALRLAAWLERALEAEGNAAAVPALKAAEAWLKREAVELRNEGFAPIADEALAIWNLLRQNSNIELGRIEFAGAGNRRRITLDVTVDGVAGAALGVMSQGELHALALSLFFPRATLEESPFRFVVIDDPVQSMDPAKVDGLAKVLERAASKRQVIVFTHDDRLPEAVRRLQIDATVIEVTRREGSVVEVRPALTPIERHIEDARALVLTSDLPEDVARRVVPGFCRLALEAGAIEAVRRRRIGRGERHAEVEQLLGGITRLTVFAAVALFDDENRHGDVYARLQSEYGSRALSAFKRANVGAHQPAEGDLRDLVRDSAVLARGLAARP